MSLALRLIYIFVVWFACTQCDAQQWSFTVWSLQSYLTVLGNECELTKDGHDKDYKGLFYFFSKGLKKNLKINVLKHELWLHI